MREIRGLYIPSENKRIQGDHGITYINNSQQNIVKGELNPKIKFVLFERTFKITE